MASFDVSGFWSKNCNIFQIVLRDKFTNKEFIGQNLSKQIDFWTIPEKVGEIVWSERRKRNILGPVCYQFLLETS